MYETVSIHTNLLCHVKAIMHGDVVCCRTQPCVKTWRLQLSINPESLFQDCLGRVNQALVVGAFLGCQQEVCLCIFEYLYTEFDAHVRCLCVCVCVHTCMYIGGVHLCMYMCRCVCYECLCACTFLGGRGGINFLYLCLFIRTCMCRCVFGRVGGACAFTCDFSDSGVLAALIIARLFLTHPTQI